MKPLSEKARIFRLREVASARWQAANDRCQLWNITLTEAGRRIDRCNALREEVQASGIKLSAIAKAAGIQKPNFHSMLTGQRPVTSERLAAVRAAIAKLNESPGRRGEA